MPCSPGMKACRLDCRHRLRIQEWRAARQAWEERLEYVTRMFKTEVRDFRRQDPPPLLADWFAGPQPTTEEEFTEAA